MIDDRLKSEFKLEEDLEKRRKTILISDGRFIR